MAIETFKRLQAEVDREGDAVIDEERKARARAYARKWWAAHPDKAKEHGSRKKRKQQQGRLNKFDAKPGGRKPEGCVWPDCFHCPFGDCTAH